MKKKTLRTTLCVALVGTVLAAFMAIATEVGSQNDPLVTLSYLNETFMNQILTKVDEKLVGRNTLLKTELEASIGRVEQELLLQFGGSVGSATGGTAVSFTPVTLLPGQTLYGSAGCEVMLRSGSAAAYSALSPALLDSTDGTTLASGGALVLNHLYMLPADCSVTVLSDAVILIRGSYLVG